MSADSPRRSGNAPRGMIAVPAIVPPQVVSDRSILDSAIGFINEVTLAHQPHTDPKDTITWARFETAADISDPRFGEDWELEGNVAPPLLLILGYGLGVQVWAIPANGEAVEVLSWRHGIVSALRVLPTPSSSAAIEENGRADEPTDAFAEKRPLIALVDGSSSSGSQPQFCAVNFISLKTGTQVKAIKFKNPVIDVLANRSSIVITFHERIAVFDARTLEDRLSITTCYPSPGINPNPIALGPRWLAYAEHKLIHSKRSGGGCDGEGVASYTATVLNASKSLVKGLRELGEQVAAGLTGTSGSGTSSKNTSFDSGAGPESKQSGVVTIIDIKNPLRDYSPTSGVPMSSASSAGADPIVAHFIAHSEALVAMEFDNSGMLLITADRRGHDFHVFRIQPNPVGPSLAAVHHLYVLHRGDTSAKVQNISFSLDSRWVAVSTLRGTTHVFPITPYGGPMGVRTHSSLHVVNKLSRFHRSAGLSAEGRSNSPISHSESTTFTLSLQPYHNTTLPPYPRPTVVMPLAQLRQPFALGSPPGSATLPGGKTGSGGQGSGSQRQRLSSLSDDSGKPLSVCAIFAKSRSWLLDPPNVTREAPHRMQRKAVDSLFVMAGHGALIQYDLDTKLASNVAKEKICDDTPIELEVEAKAQWNLGRRKEGSQEIMPPLTLDNWLVKSRNSCMLTDSTRHYDDSDDRGDSWLAQVEIVTHAGPHRRLWMGPQFVFKTYNTPSGSNLSHVDIEAVEIGTNKSTTAAPTKPDHSSPLNMPLTAAGRSSAVPVLIESGSYSSIEQSPKLMDRFRHDHLDSDYSVAHGDTRLKEDLADAMRESPSVSAASKESGSRGCETTTGCSSDNIAFYDALADHDDDQDPQDQDFVHTRNAASAAALASALPNICSFDNSSSYESIDSLKKPKASIEKIVNPLGTVTTVTSCLSAEVKTDILDEVVSQLAAEDTVIHENCDESLFRPVVAIFCDEKTRLQHVEEERKQQELCQPPENIGNKLVVPVIEKEVNDELNKKQKEKNFSKLQRTAQIKQSDSCSAKEQSKFDELSSLNKMSKVKLPVVEKESEKREEKRASKEIVKEKAPKCSEKTKQLPQCPEETPERKYVTKQSEEQRAGECQQKENIKGCSAAKESEKVDVDNNKAKKSEKVEKLSCELAKKETTQQISQVMPNKCEKTNISLNKEYAKNFKAEAEERPVAQAKEMTKDKESFQTVEKPQSTVQKPYEVRKELTPEREQSPKRANKNTAKPLHANEPERDMRIRQASEEKTPQQKPLTKKELKKQQLQKAQEDTAAQSGQSEKEKEKETTESTKKTVEKIITKTSENNKEKEKTQEKVAKSEDKEIKAKENKKENNIKEQSIVCTKASKETTPPPKSNADNTTAVVTSAKPERETCPSKSSESKINADSIKPAETAVAKDNTTAAESLQTAVKLKTVATEKTAIREETKNNSSSSTKAETEITTSAKKVPSNLIIKTEHLNVKDLADSLIELKTDDPEEEPAKKEKETAKVIQEEIPKAAITPPMETVDIFTAPVKAVNTNKKMDKKSVPSSSESEELVPIVNASTSSDTTAAAKQKVISTVTKEKSSTSSEESNADRLLERKKQDLKETPKEFVEPGREKEKEEDAKAKAKLQKKILDKEANTQQLKKSKESETMKDQAKAKSDVAKKQIKKSKQPESYAEFVERLRIAEEKEEAERKIKEEARAKARLQKKLLAKEAIMEARRLRELEWAREDEEFRQARIAKQKLLDEQAKISKEKEEIDKKEVDMKKQEEKREEQTTSESTVKPEESKTKTEEVAKTKSDSSGVKPKVTDDSSKEDIATVPKETDKDASVNINKSAETVNCSVENKTNKIEKSDKDIQSTSSKKSEEKAQTKSNDDIEKGASNILKKPVEQHRDNIIKSENKEEPKQSTEISIGDNEESRQDKESFGLKIKTHDVAKKSLTVKKDIEIKISKTESKIDNKTSSVQVTKDDDDDSEETGKQQQKVPADDKSKSEQIKTNMAKVTTQIKSVKIESDGNKSKQTNKPTVTVKSSEKLEVKKSAKELKKSDDTISPKEMDVVVDQPKKNPAHELLEALEKKEKVTKSVESDKTSNTASPTNTKVDTKTKTTSQLVQSPKTVEVKQVKTENAKAEVSAAKHLAKVTSKDTKDSSKNVTSIEAGTIPTSVTGSKQEKMVEDATNSNAEKHDEIYKIKVTETYQPKAGTSKNSADTATNSNTEKHDDIYKIKVTETGPKASTSKNSADTATKTTASVIASAASAPITSAWKTLSGADMIAINLKKQKTKTEDPVYPLLGAGSKTPKKATSVDKLLPELSTPKTASSEQSFEVKKSNAIKKSKIAAALEDFPTLQPLEPLPPLPALEPLELLSNSKISSNNKDDSLINFESPLQENPAMERKITPPPRGFTEQNLIFALCGSLHYENEQSSHVTRDEKFDVSPMTPSSSNRSSSALDEPSMADYKSLTENDDPYISLEQSSQDTNTTNTNTTNEKFSSSTNSSGTEEMIIVEEKKMTKKQKRKRQQQLLELQKHKEQRQQHTAAELDDEELRPLIAMSESQLDNIAETSRHPPLPCLLDDSFSLKPLITKSNAMTQSTTTDSEGPMPATTSDDNVFIMPSATSHAQHKIKTKKLDHKFNLIAAIEAATSSSTSSAEESGVEMGGGRSHDNDDAPPLSPSLISATASGSASASSVLPMGAMTAIAAGAAPVASLGSTVGALKKKTKRRKR